MNPRAIASDLMLVAGVGAVGWFFVEVWEPAVWLWGGLAAMFYGWRLGVADASSRDSA
jgi:hypothetical protein